MNIIDFHVHAGDFHKVREDIRGLISNCKLEDDVDVKVLFSQREPLEEYLVRNGVIKAIVLAECGPGTNFSIDSEMIAQFVSDSSLMIPFGNINPNYHDAPMREWEKGMEMGIKGYKFYPTDHGFSPLNVKMLDVYSHCEEANIPIMFHTGTTAQKETKQEFIQPNEYLEIMEKYPSLICILCHAGKPHWYEDALRLTEHYEHVYVDTGLTDFSSLLALDLETRPARHKVLFGSDWPVSGAYSLLLKKLIDTGMSTQLRQLVFHDNGKRVLEKMNIVL